MDNINAKRVLLGGLVGGVAFTLIDTAFQFGLLMQRYKGLQARGIFYEQPKIPFFIGFWILMLFAASIAGTWLYAAAREKLGPGPKTALLIGFVLGLLMGLPTDTALAAWSLAGRYVALVWCIDFVVGMTVATLVGSWIYRPES